jgi:hypothetical protein
MHDTEVVRMAKEGMLQRFLDNPVLCVTVVVIPGLL